jgi:tetratricopeptide (TPR) repeat protein
MRPLPAIHRSGLACAGLLLVLSAAVSFGRVAPRPAAPPPRDPYAEALRLEQEGKHAGAAPLFEEAAARRPAQAFFLRDRAGWNYLDADRHREARRVFTALEEQAPHFGNALDGLGLARFHTGDKDGLLALLALRLDPEERERAAAVVTAGLAGAPASVAGETEAAVKELRAAARRLDWWAPRWALAGYYYRERRPAEARRELGAVRRLAPGLWEAGPMLAGLALVSR